jgi:hypothetical protein
MGAASGTEHEFRVAYEAWKQNGRPHVMVYFNQKPYTAQSKEDTDQWGRVLEFKSTFPQEGLWSPYKGITQFEKLLRTHLTNFIRASIPVGPQLAALADRTQGCAQDAFERFLASDPRGYFIVQGRYAAPGSSSTQISSRLRYFSA